MALKVLKIALIEDTEKRHEVMKKQDITPIMIDQVANENLMLMHQTLSLAFYNLGVEYEHTQDLNQAM